MATACRFAAPLGLAPLPRSRAGAGTKSVIFSVRSTKVVQRNFVVKAASDEGPAETPEIVKAAQDAWAKVEDKYAVATIGVAGLVALWTAVGALKAIDKLPILPGVLELVGIGYTGWFTYRNLIFQPDREALISNIKSTYNEITGSSS
ncbi:protein CURVATURE THYLAKOID 1B, chloroplastic-like [Lolium rigidum]|uniref:protein CURVATURE THYLAKOID 1B, chloroplastic-like n=1 Tax=Lolium rigidum TaxID=89674 RepID=UPI001F5C61C1|nr:protein CURVATURE THYLAKOID 1B, chloroplastic-like [Lolium rigidum]XP_047066003.1 protein CURVATURE THYLAKOID 1B, chloroplastic-like [Lolium rigidum]XP_051215980.1 protein CURVATURE THYLAKOID 1B, chloroplastic-like [Lolium perenne]